MVLELVGLSRTHAHQHMMIVDTMSGVVALRKPRLGIAPEPRNDFEESTRTTAHVYK